MALTKRSEKGEPLTAEEHDANLDHVLDRANQTGVIATSSVSGLDEALALLAPLASPTFTGTVTFTGATIEGIEFGAALDAVKALTPAANKLSYYTSSSAAALTDLTAFGRSLAGAADGLDALEAIGAGDFTDWLDDVATAGGATYDGLAAQFGAYADAAGTSVDFASEGEVRSGAAGVKIVVAETAAGAHDFVALTPDTGNVAIDGSAFMLGVVTATSNITFTSPTNLDGRPRAVLVIASGDDWTVEADSPFDRVFGFGAGVEIPNGESRWFTFLYNAVADETYCIAGLAEDGA